MENRREHERYDAEVTAEIDIHIPDRTGPGRAANRAERRVGVILFLR